jgi:hypothetical protein
MICGLCTFNYARMYKCNRLAPQESKAARVGKNPGFGDIQVLAGKRCSAVWLYVSLARIIHKEWSGVRLFA